MVEHGSPVTMFFQNMFGVSLSRCKARRGGEEASALNIEVIILGTYVPQP